MNDYSAKSTIKYIWLRFLFIYFASKNRKKKIVKFLINQETTITTTLLTE